MQNCGCLVVLILIHGVAALVSMPFSSAICRFVPFSPINILMIISISCHFVTPSSGRV